MKNACSLFAVVAVSFMLVSCAAVAPVDKGNGQVEYVVNTNSPLVRTIEAVKAVNEATPSPIQPLIGLGLSTILAGFGAYAQFRNRQRTTQLEQVVDAVEDLPDGPAKQEVKSRIAKGTSTLNPIVERRTN